LAKHFHYEVPNEQAIMPDTPFKETEQAALRRFLEALNATLEASPMISGQAIRAFALVAQQPGLSVDEYAGQASVSNTVMMRHLLDLKDLVWSDRGTHYHPTSRGMLLAIRIVGGGQP
jgi:hypothetical protein